MPYYAIWNPKLVNDFVLKPGALIADAFNYGQVFKASNASDLHKWL